MLVGRDHDCAYVDALLRGARTGDSSSLVVRGDAGVGKTTLLRYAIERADGFVVLRARGVESESELPFAGLSELLRPVLGRVADLPGPQAAALAGALSIGPPVAGDQFAVFAATLNLLAAAAADGPLLVVVDDVHWLDGSSVEALAFTARRLRAEGIVLLFGLRDTDPQVAPALDSLTDRRLSGLVASDAALVLAKIAGGPVSAAVAERITAATGGNPLALVELPGLLTPGQLAGDEPITEPLPVGRSVERVFRRRVAGLPPVVGRAMLVASAADTTGLDEVVRALRALGGGLADLEVAESAGLLAIRDGRISFAHPLVRSAVYHAAAPAERRAAHRALADAVPDEAIERRPWHLAAASPGPDAVVAEGLVAAARVAVQRRSFPTAITALEQAAKLTPDPQERARRLLAAADAAQTAGRIDKAIILLEQALGLGAEPVLRAEIQHLRARMLTWRGAPSLARDMLLEEAAAIEPVNPVRAAMMFASATLPCVIVGDAAGARVAAERALRLAERVDSPELTAAATLQLVLSLLVEGNVARARLLLAPMGDFVAGCDPLGTDQVVLIAGLCHIGLEEFAEAHRLATHAVRAAREASAIGLLPFQLSWLAQINFRVGHWAAAYAAAGEALRLAEETNWLTEIPNAFIALAQVEAGQGRVDDCRVHAGAAQGMAEAVGATLVEVRALAVLGGLELAIGQPAAAVEYLDRAVALADAHNLREPACYDATADLIEANLRLGREDAAREALAALERLAAYTGLPSVRARAARGRGLLATDADVDVEFAAALAAHDEVPLPFERARTELCYGEALRRYRHRTPARRWLRSALATFEELGADPWARRAAAELSASGERARQRNQQASLQLTPQEIQVALEVAKGVTNQAAATALFLSTKTVEFHLSNIYRKLNIKSRAQLALLFATDRDLTDTHS